MIADPPVLLLACAVVLLAAAVQRVLGFGFGLCAMALLPALVGVKDAVPLVALFGVVTNVVLLWMLRRQIVARHAGPMLLGGLVGLPIGVGLLAGGDPGLVQGLLGVALILYTATALWHRFEPRPGLHDGWGVLAGAVGGVLGGAFSTGGPPVVVWAGLKGWPPDVARVALQLVFLQTAIVQIAGFTALGVLRVEHLLTDLLLLPAVGAGLALGGPLAARLDAERFQRTVLAALGATGLVYLVRAAI